MAAVSGCPSAVRTLHVGSQRTRCHAVLHSQSVEEGLDGRTHLPAAEHHHVILEMLKVYASHIGFYGSCMGIHAHEGRAEERLIIAYRVYGGHHRVYLTVISEERHFYRCAESTLDVVGRRSLLPHHQVSVALPDRAVQNVLDGLSANLRREGGVLLHAVGLVEGRLQESGHLLSHGFLGILLHTRVDGGVYAQTVGIYIIRFAVALHILVAPTIERVLCPCYRVDNKLP